MRYHNDEEVKTLAKDRIAGRVFCSDQIRGNDDVAMVFVVMSFANESTLKRMKKDDVVHLYEFLDKAQRMSVNGYPMFMSCHMLTKEDYALLREIETKMRSAIDAV